MAKPLTIEIAERVLSVDPLPADARDYCGLLIAACAGAAILGTTEEGSAITVEYVRDQTARPEASVIGAGFKTSLENASLANNTLWHSTELEGNSYPEVVSVYTLFGPALAVAEASHLPGSALIDAAVLGHELQARLALAVNADPNRPTSHHYMNMHVMGAIAVAAVVGRLLGHDVGTIGRGVSIAASQAFGIVKQTGSMTHFLESGLAARAGVIAALLAARGFKANLEILETQGGLLDIASGGDSVDRNEVFRDWGSSFRILAEGEKLFPACYLIQHLMQAARELRREASFDSNLIEDVVVETNEAHASICRYVWPTANREEEAFSVAYCVGLALGSDGDLIDTFREGESRPSWIADVASRVRTFVRKDWVAGSFAQPHTITVRLRDGQSFSRTVHLPHGHPPDRLNRVEVAAKFRSCVAGVMPSAAQDLESMLFDLDAVTDVADVAGLLGVLPVLERRNVNQEVAAQ